MFSSTHKTIAVTSVSLAALLALGACSKKVEETNTTVMPVPAATPSTGSTESSTSGSTTPLSSSSMGSGSMGTSTMGTSTTMGAPMSPASGPN